MRTLLTWMLAGWYALSALLIVGRVGRPRTPFTNADAVIGVVMAGALIAAVLYIGGVIA